MLIDKTEKISCSKTGFSFIQLNLLWFCKWETPCQYREPKISRHHWANRRPPSSAFFSYPWPQSFWPCRFPCRRLPLWFLSWSLSVDLWSSYAQVSVVTELNNRSNTGRKQHTLSRIISCCICSADMPLTSASTGAILTGDGDRGRIFSDCSNTVKVASWNQI